MSSGIVTKRRLARKAHRCECYRLISPGEVYLEHVVFPGDLFDSVTRVCECGPCAKQNFRDDLLDPVPIGQLYSQGLA